LYSSQRAGIADGGEFYIRPPEPLLIVSMSSPTIGVPMLPAGVFIDSQFIYNFP
jgi:hypothetical protein